MTILKEVNVKKALRSRYAPIIGICLVLVILITGVNCDGLSCVPGCGGIPVIQKLLVVSSTDGGSVITPGEGTFIYNAGTLVSLVAGPDTNYRFVKWTGDVINIADANAASTTITVNNDCSIMANFEEKTKYGLTVDSTVGGNVTEPGEGEFLYYEGTVVNLAVEAEEGYHFVQWAGNVSTIADIYDASTTIIMNDAYNITANFGPFAGGNGTAEDPYEIADWHDLNKIREYLDGHFVLMNDLNSNSAGYEELASPTANGGRGWQPIGNTTAENTKFAGHFDGQEYEIHDLFVVRPDESDTGLFGVLGNGTVGNVDVVNANVTGKDNVGGLAGKNEGSVNNSRGIGSVTGSNYVGGLIGKNEGTINGSCSGGVVTGNARVGGLVGQNSADITNSYSTGSVSGTSYVGGLAGNNEGLVNNSYSRGNVTGTSYVGGLVGKNEGLVNNSFWDTQTSGQATSSGGTGKTTAEMQDIDTFLGAAWDIIAVAPGENNPAYTWNIVDDQTYPFLG